MKPSLILYYYPRKENETFGEAQRNAQKSADSDKFSLILFVTREANHPGGDFINEIGHYFFGMKSRVTKRKISTRVWYGPKDLIAHLCKPKHDLKELIHSAGKSPIVLIDISPKCILDKDGKKWDTRGQLTNLELKNHFEKILSYERMWNRIKLVIFSIEPSITEDREEKYRDARELFQGMIKKCYGEKEFLNIPFFGLGPHRFKNARYWGAWDAQMKILSEEIAKSYPEHIRLIRNIVNDFSSKTFCK